MKNKYGQTITILITVFSFCIFKNSFLLAVEMKHELLIFAGQSEIIELEKSLKRVAIANPDIADATVISTTQIVVVGKTVGITTLFVWDENDEYIKFKINIRDEISADQVMLRVRFMEVNKVALKEFGSDFFIKNIRYGKTPQQTDLGFFGGRVGNPSDPLELSGAVDFFLKIPTQNFSAIFRALQENNLLNILAMPNLTAISGSEASFLAGGEFPIPIVSGSMGTQQVTIQYKEFGVRLKFIPTVLDSDLVNIKISSEVSSLDFENGIILSGFKIPSLVSRKTETTVELQEGQYLIIGGLLSNEMTETVSKIPLLGHIPILGALFSSKRYLKKESELLIAVSPQVVHPISENEIPDLQSKQEEGTKDSKKEVGKLKK